MTATAETFIDGLRLTIGSVDGYRRKWVGTVRASHEFILAKMGVINLNSENKIFGGGFDGHRLVFFPDGRKDRVND